MNMVEVYKSPPGEGDFAETKYKPVKIKGKKLCYGIDWLPLTFSFNIYMPKNQGY